MHNRFIFCTVYVHEKASIRVLDALTINRLTSDSYII